MASVTIDKGPVSPLQSPSEVPQDKWKTLLRAWRYHVTVGLSHDCRELIRYVHEAEESGMRETLGFADKDDFILNGLRLEPEIVSWALEGLKHFDVSKPVTYREAYQLGMKLAAAVPKPGPPAGNQNAAKDKTIAGVTQLNNEVATQTDRAKNNGISRWLQGRLDYLFTNDEPRFAQVQAGELSISRAYDEARDLVKTPLDKALAACDKLMPEEKRIVWQMLDSDISS